MFTKTTEKTYEKKTDLKTSTPQWFLHEWWWKGKFGLPCVGWRADLAEVCSIQNFEVIDSTTKTRKLVIDILKEKHPVAKQSKEGGAEPSGTDSEHWKDAFLRFGDEVAALITKIANEIIPWNQIRALMSDRLIALDKCPGVRPIGIGECLRRIMCKCMAEATKKNLEETCGSQQLACGVKVGIEGAYTQWRRCLIAPKRTGMVFYWWMPQMLSMHWTGKRLYGMLEYFGQGALVKCVVNWSFHRA